MSLCKVCNQELETIITFGKMPVSNKFVSDIQADEYFYDLSVGFCPTCFMVQLEHCVEPVMMFSKDYAYYSSTSETMSNHFIIMANEIADKLNQARGPVKVFIPLKGFSFPDREGLSHWEPEGNQAFIDALKEHLSSTIPLIELDAHINDADFIDPVIDTFMDMMATHSATKRGS